MELSRRWLAERAMSQMPALTYWLADASDGRVWVRLAPSAKEGRAVLHKAQCFIAKQAVAAGSIATTQAFTADQCGGTQPAVRIFRYDAATGVARTVRDVRSGESVASVPFTELASIVRGDRLYVSAHVGVVTVDRVVEAAQAAPVGHSLFVRAEDGSVFSAPAPRTMQ